MKYWLWGQDYWKRKEGKGRNKVIKELYVKSATRGDEPRLD